MLNAPGKTFSIRRLQGLCKTNPSAPGISFAPPSAKRVIYPALKPTKVAGSNGMINQTSSLSAASASKLGGFSAMGK